MRETAVFLRGTGPNIIEVAQLQRNRLYTHTYIYINVYIYTYIYKSMYAYISVHIYIQVYIFVSILACYTKNYPTT